MKPLPLNPYIAGNPVSDPKGFFGREDIFREVMQVLHHPHGNAIVLYGQRRIGKTSVLLQLEKQLASSGEFTPVYFDLQGKAAKPLSEVLYELAQRIVAKTGQPAPDRASFNNGGEYFHKNFLLTVDGVAAKGGLVLLFDEFDVLDSPAQSQAGQAFFPYLRALLAEVKHVHFVFVIGRRPEDLSIETISTFKGVPAARVSLLERKDAEAVMRQSEHDGSMNWSNDALEKVWYWAQGHPYFTQLLCSVVWDNVYDTVSAESRRIQATDVDVVIDKTLEMGANAFHWIWDGLPPAERVVMAAMAEAGDVVITLEMLTEILSHSGVRLIVRELDLAPDILVDWQLLCPSDNGYRFVVPLLRHWVMTNRPLRRVKDELDRLDPLAESLFQTGQRFYGLNQHGEADSQLRQALRINPNHLKSRLLLGRILLESDKVLESIAILEEAYRYDERATRPELIKALLALANGQAEAAMLTTYVRVLKIDPDQPIAREWWQAFWKKRGEIALKENDLETALDAFEMAGDLGQAEQVRKQKDERELAIKMQGIALYEEEEDWEKASALYERLRQDYPNDSELHKRLDYAQTQVFLAQHYSEALNALEKGESEIAQRLLALVIAQDPNYKEAVRFLLLSTTGEDVEKLKHLLAPKQKIYKLVKEKVYDIQAVLARKTKQFPPVPPQNLLRPISFSESFDMGDYKIAAIIILACMSVFLGVFGGILIGINSGLLTGLFTGLITAAAVGFLPMVLVGRIRRKKRKKKESLRKEY